MFVFNIYVIYRQIYSSFLFEDDNMNAVLKYVYWFAQEMLASDLNERQCIQINKNMAMPIDTADTIK